ncbi:uncharacterized protein DNG_01598 [Cephalotrichum gorgonifer]|uniref:Uncharacterized protein n=1 Tax=Cephalotrichum gorgonifer TaxID=2041049 RepID=A0AAE8SRY8_9PEZI|nr:uncharacterized protein DNG_01598 [Cephalotrichum gorgonifer]
MQGILTKASQARNCWCKTCASVAKTTIRRSTTGAEVRVSRGQAFTTLYTSIFATAAIIDAKYKDDRRKRLEAKISEAKDAVAQLQFQNAVAEVELPPPPAPPPSGILDWIAHESRACEGLVVPKRAGAEASPPASTDAADLIRTSIFEQYGAEYWEAFHATNFRKTLRELKRSDYHMLREWLRTSESLEVQPVSGSQPSEWTFNITQMVDYLLLEHNRLTTQQHLPPARSPLRETIDRLRATGCPNPRWPDRDATAFARPDTGLSEKMARDIDSDAIGTVERICYNLLTTQSPLTIHTYNMLILCLTKAGHLTLARCVLRSHFAHFKNHPHHALSSAICLNHDKRSGNYAGVHRNIGNILRNSTLYFSQGGRYILESMVGAFSRFCNMSDAVVTFCYGLSLGLRLSPQALIQFLGLLIWRLDREPAIMLLRTFTMYPEHFESMLPTEPAARSVVLHQLNYLLDITGLWLPSSKQLDVHLKTHGIDRDQFSSFRMTIATCDIQRQLDQVAHVTGVIEKILSSADAPKYKQMAMADTRKLLVENAGKAARGFSLHRRAAMPTAWTVDGSRMLRSRHRVWTEHDCEEARRHLRQAQTMSVIAEPCTEASTEPREEGKFVRLESAEM